MPLAGFEPAVPASEQPYIPALDRAATGICNKLCLRLINWWGFGNMVLNCLMMFEKFEGL
jgi:hypothetical protein